MEWDRFIKAQDLNNDMDYIRELQGLIENAGSDRNDRMLATIDVEGYEDARRIVVTKCKVQHHIKLSGEFKDKFMKILNEEYDRLQKEFKAL